MNRFTTILCFLLLAANGFFFFRNLWLAFHSQPEIAQFAGASFIGVACMYTAIAILAIHYED